MTCDFLESTIASLPQDVNIISLYWHKASLLVIVIIKIRALQLYALVLELCLNGFLSVLNALKKKTQRKCGNWKICVRHMNENSCTCEVLWNQLKEADGYADAWTCTSWCQIYVATAFLVLCALDKTDSRLLTIQIHHFDWTEAKVMNETNQDTKKLGYF